MEQSTKQLITDLCDGKPAAQRQLLADYGPPVFRLIVRMVGQREEAEEVYQDVFVKAMTHIKTFVPEKASLSTWLSRIAYNESLNHLRRHRQAIQLFDDSENGRWEQASDATTDTETDELALEKLEQAISQLPDAERNLLLLFYHEEHSIKEIAYITNSIPSTVGSRLTRIRQKLYKMILQTPDK